MPDSEAIDFPVWRTPEGEPVSCVEKITARVSKFDAPVDAPVHFGSLSIRVRDCEKSAPEETPESAAFLEIDEKRPGEDKAKRVFSGWMFASSPALSALEHPVYDVWVVGCADPLPEPAPPAPGGAPPPPPPSGPSRPKQNG